MNIFEKNIQALAVKDKALAAKLKTYVPEIIPELIKENGFFNLKYKNLYLHNEANPILEARSVFAGCINEPVSIHFIYGLGLGYLFQTASLNSKGTVILYEPDLNLLKVVFNFVDFSGDLMKSNVYLTDNLKKACDIIHQKSGTKNFPYMLSLPSQKRLDPVGFEELVKNLKDTVGAYFLDLKYTKKKFYKILKILTANIPELLNEIPLAKVKDFYKGKTAVIVSAGPSLDRNIETLKKYRNQYVLFVVGTALKTVVNHNITPDFICIIEPYNTARHLEGINLENSYLITEPYSNSMLHKLPFKRIFSHISANTPVNRFWGELCEEDISEYWSKGTVSYTALNSARILGCSKIVLVGQDLAYIEGQCYSKDCVYKDLVCSFNKNTGKWEITAKDFQKFADSISSSPDQAYREKMARARLKNLNSSLYYVKGINGDMIPTESVYATFVKPLSEYTHHFNDRKYINTSLSGAQIDGFENMRLEDALKDSPIIDNAEINIHFEHNYEKVKTNLKSAFNNLKTALKTIREGKQISKSLRNNLERHRQINENILSQFKKLVINYNFLSGEFTEKSKLFDFITISEKIDIDYEMKMTKELNLKNVEKIVNMILKYYSEAEERICELEKIVSEIIK